MDEALPNVVDDHQQLGAGDRSRFPLHKLPGKVQTFSLSY